MSTYLYKGRRGLLFPLGSSRVFEENLQNNLYRESEPNENISLILKTVLLFKIS